jgi:hypothetical protein
VIVIIDEGEIMTYKKHLEHLRLGGVLALTAASMADIGVPVAGFCGGRTLTAKSLGWAAGVGRGAMAAGLAPAVGCCVGGDALIMSAALIGGWTDQLTILAAFGPDGAGAVSTSAVNLVQLSAAAGATVHWWMGGGPKIPAAARLIRRTAALAAYTGGHNGAPMIGFAADACPRELRPARQPATGSSGTWAALAMAAARQREIIVFWCGSGAARLPAHWGGEWTQGASAPNGHPSGGWLADGWRWTPSAERQKLF